MSRATLRHSMLTVALIAPAVAFAQKPAAQTLFDRHAAAVGGIAAFKAVTARTESGTAEITFAGMSAGYERKVSGGKLLMTIDIAGFGQVMQGYDGAVAWSMDPQSGAKKMDASTSADAASSTASTAGLWESGSYTSAEVLDSTSWEGVSVWPVKIVGSSGRTRTVYYDRATGLKIGEVLQQDGATQKILYAEYKPFGALKVPTRVTQGTPNGDIVLNITSVKFDPIEVSVFALPDSVKALP